MKKSWLFVLLVLICWGSDLNGQVSIGGDIDYQKPRKMKVAGITVSGADQTDIQAIRLFAGIQTGQEIEVPGEEIANAIKNLWDQRLFSDVKISASRIDGEEIYLNILVQEMPQLAMFSFPGLRKSDAENLREEIKLIRGAIINENLKTQTKNIIKNHYVEKGFHYADVRLVEIPVAEDLMKNGVKLEIYVDKGEKTKIERIEFTGVEKIESQKLARVMKNTKAKAFWRVFKASKFLPKEYEEDKKAIIAKYNQEGYRNARIVWDTVSAGVTKDLIVKLKVSEGEKFYFRDITFVGNTKYSTGRLDSILNIKKGDDYNLDLLNARLYMNPSGRDVTSLYQDNGYLNFYAIPIESLVLGDSIDIEVRMMEGKQYRIGNVSVVGNTKTNDHVIYREIRTRPGDLFSRTDIIRTQRELAQLNYFNPEAFQINPTQNPADGTVDIQYVVEEKPSDQIELSGGWGGGFIVGTLGLSFTNFSMRNFFKKDAWRPLPSGDGQQFSIRAQTNGAQFQSYSISFTEPWVGGKKPNSLGVSTWWSINSNGLGRDNPLRQSLDVKGVSVSFGKRLQVPDDWFSMFITGSFQQFDLKNYNAFFNFNNGISNNLALTFQLKRNSASDPIYPTWGSDLSFTFKTTPPWSMFDGVDDYSGMSEQEKYEWLEYYKFKFSVKWYTSLNKSKKNKLVLHTNVGLGWLGSYNHKIDLSPFERFYMGGVYLTGFVLDGREIVNLRGYDDLSVTYPSPTVGSPLITKYGMELRYPLSTNPSATIYMLGFMEAGRTWEKYRDYNPFNLKRAVGGGLRIFLPMFGLLGLDYGWRLDDIDEVPNMANGQFHFSIGMGIGDL